MQKHPEFQVVTPRTLEDFQGGTLILPDVRALDETEKTWLRTYTERGKQVVITGEDATGLNDAKNIVRFAKCPGKDYILALRKDFEATDLDREHQFLESLKAETSVRVVASRWLATSIARIDGKPHVFFANFAGLRGGVNPIQTPQAGVQVTIPGVTKGRGFFLPFLGDVQALAGIADSGGMTYILPAIEKGAIFWYEP
jgi:hypothetical protein